jgi:hypothetical protein
MMRLVTMVMAAVLLATVGLGCGNSERDRGRNSRLDQPRPAAPGEN